MRWFYEYSLSLSIFIKTVISSALSKLLSLIIDGKSQRYVGGTKSHYEYVVGSWKNSKPVCCLGGILSVYQLNFRDILDSCVALRRHPQSGSRVYQASAHTCLNPSVSSHSDKQVLETFFNYLQFSVHDGVEILGGEDTDGMCKGSRDWWLDCPWTVFRHPTPKSF